MSQHRRWNLKFAQWMMTKGINYWAPFLGAGIAVKHASKDMTSIRVELKETLFNRNIVGVHFGGSIYAMCDPFYMGILLHHLGADYIVWDKAASVRFKKPGKGTIHATFHISLEKIAEIKTRVDQVGKIEESFTVHVYDQNQNTVAEVDKLIYVRRKSAIST